MSKKTLKVLGAVAGVALAIAAGANLQTLNAEPAEKVTICHAAGREGTEHFIELTLSWNGAFGQAGHFYEDGTPRAGHEQDVLGPCEKKDDDPKGK